MVVMKVITFPKDNKTIKITRYIIKQKKGKTSIIDQKTNKKKINQLSMNKRVQLKTYMEKK